MKQFQQQLKNLDEIIQNNKNSINFMRKIAQEYQIMLKRMIQEFISDFLILQIKKYILKSSLNYEKLLRFKSKIKTSSINQKVEQIRSFLL
ncbi:unnamed protein product [Paramecium pentaurelia]|uniref:Uncharacterized protein n=1 Tax=Paramecium pentaurelia TaxID=43138 RepID=A0A8S1UY79_9CILI|nr:unnamed protein product [Paramecium pentaurelia]